MLAAPVLPLPEGTPPPPPNHHNNHHDKYHPRRHQEEDYYEDEILYDSTTTVVAPASQNDLFKYKARECKSAPAPPTRKLEDFGNSDDGSSSSSSISSSFDNNNSKMKRCKSSKHHHRHHHHHKKASCFSRCCSWFSSLPGYFLGHCPAFTAWSTSYSSTSRLKYLSLFFLESSLRSIGNVTLCGNPFSGLIIFIAMLISCPLVAFLAFVTLTFGIETAVVFLHVPMEEVRSGVVTFNNFLAGTVIALIAQQDVILAKPEIIGVCIAVGVLTVIIWKGVNGLLATSYLDFPMLNAPFHLMLLLYIYSGIAERYEPIVVPAVSRGTHGIQANEDLSLTNATGQMYNLLGGNMATTQMPPHFTPIELDESQTFVEPLNWEKIFFGVLLAPSQVFGTGSLYTSGMVHFAMLIYSPIMLLQSLTGSAIGTLMGICLTNPEEWEKLYNGSWGYNPLFTMASIGGFFVVFNIHSWLLSIVGGVLTTLLYSAMVKCHVPALGIPFMLITWLLLPSIPPPASLGNNSSNDSSKEVVVVQISGGENKVKQAFDDVKEKEDEVEEEIASESASGPFIRLPLSQITTPEGNRKKFLPRKRKRMKSVGIGRRMSTIKDGGENVMGSIKNGVMNKYKSSFSDTPPQDQLPPELSMGVGHNSILPL